MIQLLHHATISHQQYLPEKNGIEIRDTPAENTPKKTIIEPKNVFHGSDNTAILEKIKVPLT